MTSSKDSRPTPGPRAEDRHYWDGHEEEVKVGGSRRMVGVDAARGFALFDHVRSPPAAHGRRDPE